MTITKEFPAYNVKAMVKNIEDVFKTGDITKLNKPAYSFVTLHMSFIAHYSLHGFHDVYRDLRKFCLALQTGEFSDNPGRSRELAGEYERREARYGQAYHDSVVAGIRGIVKVAQRYEQRIQEEFNARQRWDELIVAYNILIKYGLEIPQALREELGLEIKNL